MILAMSSGGMKVINQRRQNSWKRWKENQKHKRGLEDSSRMEAQILRYFGQRCILHQLFGASFSSCKWSRLGFSGWLQQVFALVYHLPTLRATTIALKITRINLRSTFRSEVWMCSWVLLKVDYFLKSSKKFQTPSQGFLEADNDYY